MEPCPPSVGYGDDKGKNLMLIRKNTRRYFGIAAAYLRARREDKTIDTGGYRNDILMPMLRLKLNGRLEYTVSVSLPLSK